VTKKSEAYVIGIDQMVLPLTQRLAADGTIPTIAKLPQHGASCQALSSYPCYTANSSPVIATGATTRCVAKSSKLR